MARLSVHLTFEPDDGRPVRLARIRDAEVLRSVARVAISTARANARRAGGIDWLLGRMRAEEAKSLEEYFNRTIPGFADHPAGVTR